MGMQNPLRCAAAFLLIFAGAISCGGFDVPISERDIELSVLVEEINSDVSKLYDPLKIVAFLRSAIETHPVIDGYDLTKTKIAYDETKGAFPGEGWGFHFGDWYFNPEDDGSKIARTRVLLIRARAYHHFGERAAPQLKGVRVLMEDPLLRIRVPIPAQTGRFSLTWYITRPGNSDAEKAVEFSGHLEPDGSMVMDSVSIEEIITFHI
jgi:hypothetical protein